MWSGTRLDLLAELGHELQVGDAGAGLHSRSEA
jgi:hypothetical protein